MKIQLKILKMCFYGLLTSLLIVSPSYSDDAVEALSPDIQFQIDPNLIMEKEILTINKLPHLNHSATSFIFNQFKIEVDFYFKNISKKDITHKVAFVLPPSDCRSPVARTSWEGLDGHSPGNQSLPFNDFKVIVNNNPVNYTKRFESTKNGKVIDQLLTSLNLPLNPCSTKFHYGNDGYPTEPYRSLLTKNHLLSPVGTPDWIQNSYFEWIQHFPSGKVLHIHHEYTPASGQQLPSLYVSKKELFNNPVIDNKLNNFLWNGNLDKLKGHWISPAWIRYKLTTGAFWKGGIRSFKLIINNNSDTPFAINTFYQDNATVKKIMKDRSMTFETKDFTPKKDLLIIFLDKRDRLG